MKIVAFVPIKINSERVKGKNIKLLGSKPLCYYAINELLSVKNIDDVYVFCSDPVIKKYIPKKAKFLRRSVDLDKSTTKGLEIYKSFVEMIDADIYVLVHVTSPFLKSSSLSNALEHVLNMDYDSAFSVKRIKTFVWYLGKPLNYSLNDIPRTQEIEPIYYETSSFYIFKRSLMINENRRIGHNPFLQEVDDEEAIDIDEEHDFQFASFIMKNKEKIDEK